MKNVIGDNMTLTLFGESHGECVGAVLDGIAPGLDVDEEYIAFELSLRRPFGKISTSRVERDEFKILSGVYNGKTTGTPICLIIPNEDKISSDYIGETFMARPGHADYVGHVKYEGFEDPRGGGHFSGRITSAIVGICGIIRQALEKKGILVGTHILDINGIADRHFGNYEDDVKAIRRKQFPVLTDDVGSRMIERIEEIKEEGDSVGGTLETSILGLEAGLGEPFFDSVESRLAHLMFSIPGVKAIGFGKGQEFSMLVGSAANDPLHVEDGRVVHGTNNSGGINGGITNGMPVVFTTTVRPTPTIAKEQDTIDLLTMKNGKISGKGRHDPCIVHRVRAVVDSLACFAVADMLAGRRGTDL